MLVPKRPAAKPRNKAAPRERAAAPAQPRKLAITPVSSVDAKLGYLGSIVVDGHRIWAVGGTYHKPTIMYSEDRGHTFTRWKHPEAPGIRDVHVDGNTVWVVGEWGCVAHTSDGGATWTKVDVGNVSCLYSIMPDSKGRLWILGDGGLLLRIKPGGKRPTKVPNESSARILYMFIEEGDVIWLLDSAGMLQRSTKQGFEEVSLAAMRTARPLCALVRTPAKTLLLLGDGGLILRSTNNGASWKKIPIDSRNDLEKILVTMFGIFVVGAKGSLLVSHDDGRSFQGLDVDVGENHLWSIGEIDGSLVIGGERGGIWRVEKRDLADLMSHAYQAKDPLLSDLAARVRDGDEGADMVLEDALRERELL
jgi:photosystem II stability/assembly factor-like uncharacterized protein